MKNPQISESRIRSERFYAIHGEGQKIDFYTTNIAAARYWIKHVVHGEPIARAKEAANLAGALDSSSEHVDVLDESGSLNGEAVVTSRSE